MEHFKTFPNLFSEDTDYGWNEVGDLPSATAHDMRRVLSDSSYSSASTSSNVSPSTPHMYSADMAGGYDYYYDNNNSSNNNADPEYSNFASEDEYSGHVPDYPTEYLTSETSAYWSMGGSSYTTSVSPTATVMSPIAHGDDV
jgi:hypothetical protein